MPAQQKGSQNSREQGHTENNKAESAHTPPEREHLVRIHFDFDTPVHTRQVSPCRHHLLAPVIHFQAGSTLAMQAALCSLTKWGTIQGYLELQRRIGIMPQRRHHQRGAVIQKPCYHSFAACSQAHVVGYDLEYAFAIYL